MLFHSISNLYFLIHWLVIHGFLTQFGITYNQDKELRKLMHKTIPDDPQLDPPIKFGEGIISYAGSGDNSRSSHLFIAYKGSEGSQLGTQKWVSNNAGCGIIALVVANLCVLLLPDRKRLLER
jgi:hypothetical protein